MGQPPAQVTPTERWLAQIHTQGEQILAALGEIRDRLPDPSPSTGPGPVELSEPQSSAEPPAPGVHSPTTRGRAAKTLTEPHN